MSDDAQPEDIEDVSEAFAPLLEAASKLTPDDDVGVAALMAEAAAAGLTDVQSDMLAKAIQKATHVGLKTLRRAWAKALADTLKGKHAAEAPERARREEEARVEAARKRGEERARLSASCSSLAHSPTLLAEMEAVAHRLGLVNEGAAARAVYLTYTSRLLVDDAIRMLRSGASASGKNAVVELTLPLIPSDAVVQISASSPKSLAYYGGKDQPDALKHKIVYIPEAVPGREKARGDRRRRRQRVHRHVPHSDQRGSGRLSDCDGAGRRTAGNGHHHQERPDRRSPYQRSRSRPGDEDPGIDDGNRRVRRADRSDRRARLIR
jgi:hypothetical protein